MVSIFSDKKILKTVLLMLSVEFAWGIGVYVTLTSTTLPTYFSSLNYSKILAITIFLVTALPLLMQFFGRSLIEKFKYKKKGLIFLHLFVIAPYLVIAYADFLFLQSNPQMLALIICVMLAFSQFSIGFIIPVWMDMIARIIPEHLRGQYFGFSSGFVAIGGVLGGAMQIYFVNTQGLAAFRYCFFSTAVFYIISMCLFSLVPIAESAFEHPKIENMLQYLKKGFSAFTSKNFRLYIVSCFLFTVATGIIPYLVNYATDPVLVGSIKSGIGLPKEIFSQMTFIQALIGGIGAMIIGIVIDKRGPRRPWLVFILFIPVVLILFPMISNQTINISGILLNISPAFLISVSLLGMMGISWAVTAPAVLEFSPDGDKSSPVALANFTLVPAAATGPMLMQWVINNYGYKPAFLLSIGIAVTAAMFALFIRERVKREDGQAQYADPSHHIS
jgi:MFS family permease